MKKHKILALLLAVVLLLPLTACTENTPVDTWDGSISESFSGGDGSESSPYEISSCAELAYLAKSTNEGNDYAGKHFSLKSNLDLNNLEWTPIGTYESQFGGDFDGNGHTISNLRMSDTVFYTFYYSEEPISYTRIDIAGLFGICENASLCNLALDGVDISATTPNDTDGVTIGSLVAKLTVTSNNTGIVKNIDVKNSSLVCALQRGDARSPRTTLFGGIIGQVDVQENAEISMSKVQSNVKFDICPDIQNNRNSGRTYVGGITAHMDNNGIFELSDFATSTDGKFVDITKYWAAVFYGAIGWVSNSGTLRLRNAFTEIKLAQPFKRPYNVEGEGLTATAIISCSHLILGGTIEFENLFGTVKRTDDPDATHNVELFFLTQGAVYTETNCKATDTLPENHGFDPEIWNLDDLSNPKLK